MVLTVIQPGEASFLFPEEDLPVGPVVPVVSLEDDGVVVDCVHRGLRPEHSPQHDGAAHRLGPAVTQIVPHSAAMNHFKSSL